MTDFGTLHADLARIGEVRTGEPMRRHTTFGIGGPADLYIKVHTGDALVAAFMTARAHQVPVFVLGSGSNILVGDRGIRGVVIENEARDVSLPVPVGEDAVQIVAESGASFASLGRRMSRAGYAGLEWAAGIPGTVGGAVVYNAGAYGGCLADALVSIEVADAAGARRTLTAAELHLEYRSSDFTRGLLRHLVVVRATFRLRAADPAVLAAQVTVLDAKRLATQPRGRNAGSIFKNPPGVAAWRLIDQAGLRGYRTGDAEISAKHTNFFTNAGNAQAADVLHLINMATARVQEQFQITLHREVELVGEF